MDTVWTWTIIALLLLFAELMTGTLYLLWMAISAAIMAVLILLLPIAWPTQLLIFALFIVLSCGLWAWWRYQYPPKQRKDEPLLNERASSLIGRQVRLTAPISQHHGRVKIDGLYWQIYGEDCPAGTLVVVDEVKGIVLQVSCHSPST